jgi:hypothetical protein
LFEATPEGLWNDLKAIIDLSDGLLDKLYKHLSEAQGFLNPKALLETIQTIVEDSNAAKAAQRIIINVRPSQVGQLVTFLEEKSKDKDFPFDQAQLKRLKQILKNLIRPYPSLSRFLKAEHLANITGQQLEAVELICDLRPIFDESRKNIEGMMPYTRLHIVATGEDGLPKAFEAELTHQQVIDLAEKTGKAKSKLETLHQSIENWLPGGLPDLPLTRIPQKESSDV